MVDAELQERHTDLISEVIRNAEALGESQRACFFDQFATVATENGDSIDLQYTPVRKDGARAFQIDGFATDLERGECYLAVCDFEVASEIRTINQNDIVSLFGRVERFFQSALSSEFVNSLEESSPTFQAAYPIFANQAKIRRVRVLALTNAKLAVRSKKVDSKEFLGRTFTYNVLDLTRYDDIERSQGGHEPIEIDISELNGGPLPCLDAHTSDGRYKAYLAAVPGNLLVQIYGRYGARLLEQNVRSFLQARGKVNQGIIRTIFEKPEMFFAYNNGITATASGIELESCSDGRPGIRTLRDFQIVNGGQTTASILYARDNPPKSIGVTDLTKVFVQMKLSIIDPSVVEEVVPRISEYANTQNRITASDLFANHPFHLEMEKISRRLLAPPKPGHLGGTKWFYERARGQYKNARGMLNPGSSRKFEAEYPKDQVLTKTDLAKVELTFECLPHKVSLGAQKCFSEYANVIDALWKVNQLRFNDTYFKHAIAKTIIFNWTDTMVGASDWYKLDRGYKANIVTYTIAWLVNHLVTMRRAAIDFDRIWNLQKVPDDLGATLQRIAPVVAEKLKAAPGDIRNVSEYCKRPVCWTDIRTLNVDPTSDLSTITIDLDAAEQQMSDAAKVRRIDIDIEFDRLLLRILGSTASIYDFAKARNLLSPKSDAALRKLQRGDISVTNADRNSLKNLFERMAGLGFTFD